MSSPTTIIYEPSSDDIVDDVDISNGNVLPNWVFPSNATLLPPLSLTPSKYFDVAAFPPLCAANTEILTAPPLHDSPYILHNNVHLLKESLLTTTANTDKQIYKVPPPTSRDARQIWMKASIPNMATIRTVERRLLDWALTNAILQITDGSITHITWNTAHRCVCSSSWPAFLRWIICAASNNS